MHTTFFSYIGQVAKDNISFRNSSKPNLNSFFLVLTIFPFILSHLYPFLCWTSSIFTTIISNARKKERNRILHCVYSFICLRYFVKFYMVHKIVYVFICDLHSYFSCFPWYIIIFHVFPFTCYIYYIHLQLSNVYIKSSMHAQH